jgi:hypothetical protein
VSAGAHTAAGARSHDSPHFRPTAFLSRPCAPQNCNNTLDTVLFVGTGCPTDDAAFGCVGGADGGCPAGSISPSSYTVAATTRTVYYVVVQMWSSTGYALTTDLSYVYTPSTPSETITASPTGSPLSTVTNTASATATATVTPSSTASYTTVPTPSITASPSNSLAADQSPSETASPSYSVTATPTPPLTVTTTSTPPVTPSATTTGTRTRSPTPTQTTTSTRTPSSTPQCPYPGATIRSASGLSGTLVSSTAAYALGWTGACAGLTSSNGPTTLSIGTNNKIVIKVDLSGYPTGGLLSMSNCGLSVTDSKMFVGVACPVGATDFACVQSNE